MLALLFECLEIVLVVAIPAIFVVRYWLCIDLTHDKLIDAVGKMRIMTFSGSELNSIDKSVFKMRGK